MNLNDLRPGDIVLVHTDHFVSKLIRFGQRGYGEFSRWNHVAIVVASGEDPTLIEALTKGVEENPLSKYPAENVKLIPVQPRGLVLTNTIDMRYNAALFAVSCKGEEYGFVTILAIALKTLFKGRFNFGVQGTSICSGLAARSLERLGYDFNPWDPAELTPAYLAKTLP